MRANILQKVLTTVLALTTALSMAACGGKPAGASVPADASGSGVSSAVEQPREESSAAEESKTSSSAAEESKISSSTAEEPKTSSSAAESSEPESSGAQVLAMDAPSWETQLVSFDNVTFELPASWKKNETTTHEGVLVYSPRDTGPNINITSNGDSSDYTISDLFEQLVPNLEASLAEQVGEISNFKAEPVKLPCGDALKTSFSLNDEIAMDMTQYYILTNPMVVVTVTNLDEELTPPIDEVAAYMLYTLKEV